MALAGMRNLGLTEAQILEYGRAPSRETAQSVREDVVAG